MAVEGFQGGGVAGALGSVAAQQQAARGGAHVRRGEAAERAEGVGVKDLTLTFHAFSIVCPL